MPDVNYVAHLGNGGGYNDIDIAFQTTTAVKVLTYNFANPPVSTDRNGIMVSAFR
jgi:hypothetical protein